MKSSGDPILDLQNLCKIKPMSEDELKDGYLLFGWGVPFQTILQYAVGTYIVKGDDGLYRPRDGKVEDIVSKVLEENKGKQ